MVLAGSSIGRYLVKRKLAEGGMAELYLCTAVGHEGFEKEVVIKRIKAFLSSDQGFIDMFKAEARLASRLNHANVVQIFDFDKHDDAWFIAMEYVHGASLWELRRRCRELAMPFPPILVAAIGAQVARGLHYAHTLSDKGKPLALVHRDVTPHNVLLSFDGGVKLTDFGIAKAGTNFTAPGMLKGKFAYMSPEQARGEKVDARCDVFALGITLWEMLTGGRLFEGDSDVAVLRAVQESLIAPPARLNPDVPTELSQIVLKTLARPLDQRFQSAHELDRALSHFVLKSSSSTDDSNSGLFLRQMFRDELEAAERALSIEHPLLGLDASQTRVIDGYALGKTRQVNRHHEPPTQQTATPAPSVPTANERPKTAQMPGVRAFAPMDLDDETAKRSGQKEQLEGAAKEQTAQMPGLRPSRRLAPVDPPPSAPTVFVDPPVSLPAETPPAVIATELPRKTLLPWIVTACVAVGMIGGLAVAVLQAQPAVKPPSPIEDSIVATAPEVPPQKPAELAVAVAVAVGGRLPEGEPVDEVTPEPEREPVAIIDGSLKPDEGVTGVSRRGIDGVRPKGTLLFDAIPYGSLHINNRLVATDVEGSRKFLLAPGVYSLRLVHPKLTKIEEITVKPGQVTSVRFRPLQ